MANEYLINSIIRAVDILELYNHHDTELGISEMARRLNLYKSTVYRIVSTLEHKGMLEQDPQSGKYRLGLKLYKLGILARNDDELISISSPHLKRLTEKTGETSNMVVMDGSMSVYIAQYESSRMVRMFTRLGAKVFPHCNGAGKVLLSDMTEDEIEYVIAANGLPRYTQNTITTREKLMNELKLIKSRGYAVDNQEREEGVMCLAAPVKDGSGKVIAAISISGPRDRFGKNRVEELIRAVREEAGEISTACGYKQDS